MGNVLLNYLYPGAVTAIKGWALAPPLLDFPHEYSLLNPGNCCDGNDATYVEVAGGPGALSDMPLTFYITTVYKWYPTYLYLDCSLDTGMIDDLTISLYKDSTRLTEAIVDLAAERRKIIFALNHASSAAYPTAAGNYSIVFSKNVSSVQTLRIYTLELGEYKFSSLKECYLGESGDYTPNVESQSHITYMQAGSRDETTYAPHPRKMRRSASSLDPICLFSVDAYSHSSIIDQARAEHKFYVGSSLRYFVEGKNFFYNSGCASTTLYPNLKSASHAVPTPTNGSITMTTSTLKFTKGSTPETESVFYLGENSPTDEQSVGELSLLGLGAKLVLSATGKLTTGTSADLILEEYRTAGDDWVEIAKLTFTSTSAYEHLTSCAVSELYRVSTTGIRAYLSIPADQPEGTIFEIDDLYLGVVS